MAKSLIDKKREIFSTISALNILSDGLPKPPPFNSFSSINNKSDTLSFIIELIISLVGINGLKDFIIDVLANNLLEIERELKLAIKNEIKEIISCDVDPSIPNWLNTTGIDIELKKIDVFNIFKINPKSDAGRLIYYDVFSEKNSFDFNTYLYYKIQDPGSTESWGNSTIGNEIITVVFNETTPNGNNILNIKTNYGTGNLSNKKLSDLNSDLLASMSIFSGLNAKPVRVIINDILEELFSYITNITNKSFDLVEEEVKIKSILWDIINSETTIDDSYFTIDNPKLTIINEEANKRFKGYMEIKGCGNVSTKLPTELVNDINNDIEIASNKIDEKKIIENSFNNIINQQTKLAGERNIGSIKLNLYSNIINNLIMVFVSKILSPKILLILVMNYKIIYGQNEEYKDIIDFMKKNRVMINNIVKKIRDLIFKILLKKVIKIIINKLKEKYYEDIREQSKLYINVILSYLRTPVDINKLIENL